MAKQTKKILIVIGVSLFAIIILFIMFFLKINKIDETQPNTNNTNDCRIDKKTVNGITFIKWYFDDPQGTCSKGLENVVQLLGINITQINDQQYECLSAYYSIATFKNSNKMIIDKEVFTSLHYEKGIFYNLVNDKINC